MKSRNTAGPARTWQLKAAAPQETIAALAEALNNLPEPLARTLCVRGITTFEAARAWFRAGPADLHSPWLMQDMDVAVDRLQQAIDRNERIVVYGDYDVDGTTATTLLVRYLRDVGNKAAYFVPTRFEHGYGLSKKGIDEAVAEGADLIVALDCGVTAIAEAEYIGSLGIDLIVCDHHTTLDVLPHAVAVLNPKRTDCAYPFKDLCAVGLAFKLVAAMEERQKRRRGDVLEFLDLVALGTAADVVSVTDENRILLREGLVRLRQGARVGLRMLAEEAGLRLSSCTASQIIFSIGPRINAAGRVGNAERAVALMLAVDEVEGSARARQLERLNDERRELDREAQTTAFEAADRLLARGHRHTLVLHNEDWHMGVIGIVASRLVERHFRPTVMMTTVNGMAKGSARSVAGINIYQALEACSDMLTEFGGHDFAAGVTLPIDRVDEFAQRFEAAVTGAITADVLTPVVEMDAELPVSMIDQKLWKTLRQFAPYGPDNEMPVFLARDLVVTGPISTVGKDRSHLRFAVRDAGGGHKRNVIGFKLAKHLDIVTESQATGAPLEMLYAVQENTWNGRTSLQLEAKDIRLGEQL